MIDYYARRGEQLDHPAGLRTLDTNSTLAPGRTEIVLEVLAERGLRSVAGLDVIDLGCGFGSLSLCLAVAGARVTGIDPHADRLSVATSVARSLDLPAAFRTGQMEALGLDDLSADVAVMNNSFCYVMSLSDRRRALGHVLRILRPGGWLVIRDPARGSPIDPFTGLPLVHQLPPSLARRLPRLVARNRSNVRLRSRRGLRRELRAAGFVEVRSARAGSPRRKPQRYQHLSGRKPTLEELRSKP